MAVTPGLSETCHPWKSRHKVQTEGWKFSVLVAQRKGTLRRLGILGPSGSKKGGPSTPRKLTFNLDQLMRAGQFAKEIDSIEAYILVRSVI